MKTTSILAAGLIGGAVLLSIAVTGVEARGSGGQGQNLRLRDGSCTTATAAQQGNTAAQRGPANSTGVRPGDGTGNGFGDGTKPRPLDGTGFGSGNKNR